MYLIIPSCHNTIVCGEYFKGWIRLDAIKYKNLLQKEIVTSLQSGISNGLLSFKKKKNFCCYFKIDSFYIFKDDKYLLISNLMETGKRSCLPINVLLSKLLCFTHRDWRKPTHCFRKDWTEKCWFIDEEHFGRLGNNNFSKFCAIRYRLSR